MTNYTAVSVRRPRHNVVEWMARRDEMGEPVEVTMHANRSAMFVGPYDGRYAHQVSGTAYTVWSASDHVMLRRLSQRYRTDNVNFTA